MIETKTAQLGKHVELSGNVYELDSTFSSHSIGYIEDHIKHILNNLKMALDKLKKPNVNQQPIEPQEMSDSDESA